MIARRSAPELIRQHRADIGLGDRGVQFARSRELRFSLGDFPLIEENGALVEDGRGIATAGWSERFGLVSHLRRLVELLLLVVDPRERVVRVGGVS